MHAKQNEIRKHLVAFELEVMFGEPHGVVAQCIGCLRPINKVFIAFNNCVVVVSTTCRGNAGVTCIWHGYGTEKVCVDAHGNNLLNPFQTCVRLPVLKVSNS